MRVIVEARDRHARLRGDLPGARVDRTQPREATNIEHDLAVQRHRPADEPGVPTLGHDTRARVAAGAEHGGDFVDGAGSDDCGCRAGEAARPVVHLARDDIGVGEHMPVADRFPQGAEQRLRSSHLRSV